MSFISIAQETSKELRPKRIQHSLKNRCGKIDKLASHQLWVLPFSNRFIVSIQQIDQFICFGIIQINECKLPFIYFSFPKDMLRETGRP